jgi:hypothetical protein
MYHAAAYDPVYTAASSESSALHFVIYGATETGSAGSDFLHPESGIRLAIF